MRGRHEASVFIDGRKVQVTPCAYPASLQDKAAGAPVPTFHVGAIARENATAASGSDVASGASAGMTSTLLTYPLDLVRSRLMMMSASASATKGSAQYTGILDCFVKTYRQEGVRGLYGGLGPTLAGIIPYAGVSFAAFDVIKEYMPRDEQNKIATRYKLLCGAFAGFLSQSVSYPVDTVRRRMQLQGCTGGERMYKNAIDCTAQVFRKEGLFAFYRGLSANLLRAAPNTAIQFAAYEKICHWLNLKKL